MITFQDGNLRIPNWSRPVYMAAGGCTPFKKSYPEYKLEELCMIAFRMMLEDNGLKMAGKERPEDWKSLQVDNAQKALWISHAGVGSHVTAGVLEKGW